MASQRDDRDDEGFLSRWSRRKIEGDAKLDTATPASHRAELPSTDGAPESDARVDGEAVASDLDAREGGVAEAETGAGAGADAADDRFADVDFEALDYTSDYTRFMSADVPDSVRNQALQKLWTSDPVLANIDGLTDYSDDFTDAALAVPLGMLKTAHKVGRGFLSDEDVTKWEALGKETAVAPDTVASGAAADLPMAVIGLESPVQDEIRILFAQSDAYTHALYPPDSNHMTSPEALVAAGAIFAVARCVPPARVRPVSDWPVSDRPKSIDPDAVQPVTAPAYQSGSVPGPALGCGALIVPGDGTGEIKRMWVAPQARGQQLGAKLLQTLIAEARDRSLSCIRLETGNLQVEAIGLYERAGFVRRGPFSGYTDDPNSVFMELRLATGGDAFEAT